MGEVKPFRRPIRWSDLRPDEAEVVIGDRSSPENTANVIFTNHAFDRVGERDITRLDAFRILRTGSCVDGPKKDDDGNWVVTMAKRLKGRREAGVVTVIVVGEEKLIIPTIEWMD
ncbi:MAG: DUF4258 domain-containing protein [Pikeienuella sp.]